MFVITKREKEFQKDWLKWRRSVDKQELNTKVGEILNKVQESRLKWYGHVLRRKDEYVVRRQERDGDGGAGE